jgi:hypothetical protein
MFTFSCWLVVTIVPFTSYVCYNSWLGVFRDCDGSVSVSLDANELNGGCGTLFVCTSCVLHEAEDLNEGCFVCRRVCISSLRLEHLGPCV